MDAKIKREWLKALRGGEYRQGQSYLKSGNKYCCLGVLASVSGCSWKKDDWGSVFPVMNGKKVGDENYLVGGFAGLRAPTMKLLATKNDNGSSFQEIAEYIEKRIGGK